MTYRVFYTHRVIAEIASRVRSLRDDRVDERTIAAWFTELFDAIDDLQALPRRFPIDEPESKRRGREIRKMSFRNYIIRYRVEQAQARVYVLSFMHGARRRER
ncbi:MAG: type II toxin-antitoxin system RelE/ParE family toxin [Phycisphaeraceae bacterium]